MKRSIWTEIRQLLRSVDRELFVRDWSTKALALVLALVVFIATRDQVSRTFWIPLKVQHDDRRQLLTDLPSKVGVEVRGPWAQIKRLTSQAFGQAKLDLRAAKEGPLEIDAATIVIPQGVFLANRELQYDPVDLRFDRIVIQEVPIVPQTTGSVHRYSELVSVEVHPSTWKVRGPEAVLSHIERLSTEEVSLGEQQESIEKMVRLRPLDKLQFVGGDEGFAPVVKVRLKLRQKVSEALLTVDVDRALKDAGIDLEEPVSPQQQVKVFGPQIWLEAIQNEEDPIQIDVVSRSKDRSSNLMQIELRLRWAAKLAPELKAKLKIEPALVRLFVRVQSKRNER